MPAADEQQLIVQAKDGNHTAFRHLVERYMRHAYNIAYSFVGNHDDAQDVAQETFVRIHRSLSSFRGDAEFSTWMYRIIMNVSLNRLHEQKRRPQGEMVTSDAVKPLTDSQAGDPVGFDLQDHVEQAIHKLPALQRAVVILRHIDGLSTKEVSEILRCSEGTVKTHLHRGLKKMRTMLDFLKDE